MIPFPSQSLNPAINASKTRGSQEQPAVMNVQGEWRVGDIIELRFNLSREDGAMVPMGSRKIRVEITRDANTLEVAGLVAVKLADDKLLSSGYSGEQIYVAPTDESQQLEVLPAIVFKPEGAQPREPLPIDEGAQPENEDEAQAND